MTIQVLDVPLSICKLSTLHGISWETTPLFLAYTGDEISLVCQTGKALEGSVLCDDNWRALKVIGPLEFSLTGILAKIAAILAEARIPIFALSTYDTDYILVKEERLYEAMNALIVHGYGFVL